MIAKPDKHPEPGQDPLRRLERFGVCRDHVRWPNMQLDWDLPNLTSDGRREIVCEPNHFADRDKPRLLTASHPRLRAIGHGRNPRVELRAPGVPGQPILPIQDTTR